MNGDQRVTFYRNDVESVPEEMSQFLSRQFTVRAQGAVSDPEPEIYPEPEQDPEPERSAIPAPEPGGKYAGDSEVTFDCHLF